ncbi:MAG: DUF6610 family protein [Aggregatilineales bacterium]
MTTPDTHSFQNRIVGHGEMPADQFVNNPDNPRVHPQKQRDAIKGSLNTLGFIAPVIVNKTTGYLVDGHERIWAALNQGDDTPVPYIEIDLTPDEEKLALTIYDWTTVLADYDTDMLDTLMQQVQTDDANLQATLADMAEEFELYVDDFEVDKTAQPNPRNLNLDMIYTLQMADCTCCLAVQAGLKYGIQSATYRLCPYCGELSGRHKVTFIDNDYFNYQHDVHLKAIQELTPKYATVCDVMTPVQCKQAGIEHYSFDQILDWAEELDQYAENVIIIPKYDCLEQIPDKFMLGYSVPTSHGGTPLPPEAFTGRRVHLLGGSWKAQLAHMAILGDDVVSVDNNYILKQAQFGSFVYPDGESGQLTGDLNIPRIRNPRYVALAISFGHIAAKLNELYPQAVEAPA